MLELAIGYARRGARDDAVLVLNAADGPIARAWHAWLPTLHARLEGPAELAFAFPYRAETLPVLQWVTTQNPHWSWRYLLALNLWALDRADEAATVMADIEGIDNANALVTRALLLERERGTDPLPDLRRATSMDPSDRMLRVRLVDALEARNQWSPAVAVTTESLRTFRDDFVLELLQVTALIHLDRAAEAIRVLDRTMVLPSEHARESHHLWQQAHAMAALDALQRRRYGTARTHLERALTWPEHLGQGRPYEADERLVRYLQAVVAARSDPGTPITVASPVFANAIDARLVQRAQELTP